MMDSAICLQHRALNIPPTTTCRAAGLARPNASFRPSYLSFFSKASTYRTLSRNRFSSSVVCALNKPSPPSPDYDKDNGGKIVRVVGGASVVLACVLGAINCNYNFSPTAIAGTHDRSSSSFTPGGGADVLSLPKTVLDSMLTVNRHLAKPKHKIRRKFKWIPKLSIPERPNPEDRTNLKIAVADLIKSGMCDEAERQLIKLYEEKTAKRLSEPARDVDMELVLVLIFQGKYKEALARDCLRDDTSLFSDGRVHFYKAIILTMLEDDAKAEECWERFVSSFSATRGMRNVPEVEHPKQPRKER